jgi:hypothetical protein
MKKIRIGLLTRRKEAVFTPLETKTKTSMKPYTKYERVDYGGIGKENLVTLTVKLPDELRRYWQIEAKKRNQSLALIITEALKKELGTPDNKEKDS